MFGLYDSYDLTEEEKKALLMRQLLGFGSSMLIGSGQGIPTGQGLGGGVLAGLQAGDQGLEAMLRRRQSTSDQAMQERKMSNEDARTQASLLQAIAQITQANKPGEVTQADYEAMTPEQRALYRQRMEARYPPYRGGTGGNSIADLLADIGMEDTEPPKPEPKKDDGPGILDAVSEYLKGIREQATPKPQGSGESEIIPINRSGINFPEWFTPEDREWFFYKYGKQASQKDLEEFLKSLK